MTESQRDQAWSAKLAQTQPGVLLRTLVGIRWTAVVGQASAVLVTGGLFGFPIPWLPALSIIAALAVANLVIRATHAPGQFLTGRQAALHLAFDLLQLAALLFVTGGLVNPFVVLILVPVTISATLLSYRSTFALLMLAAICLTVMLFKSLPLPWISGTLQLPQLYRFGVWNGLILCMILLAIYAWRLSNEARRRQQALVATQAALAREQKLSELGALAAAAAHELGGPLGTILLIATDLDQQIGDDPDFGNDIKLLKSESIRGRSILTELSERIHADAPFAWVNLETLLREVAGRNDRGDVTVDFDIAAAAKPLKIERTPEVLHALGNLIDNACRHARTHVRLSADRTAALVIVGIEDDGNGFPDGLLPRLGEPYLADVDETQIEPRIGLGLGIFIAVTLLDRTGATCSFANARAGGARVSITWPEGQFQVAEQDKPL
jgi:two-component system, sensor histidine kinase RegB